MTRFQLDHQGRSWVLFDEGRRVARFPSKADALRHAAHIATVPMAIPETGFALTVQDDPARERRERAAERKAIVEHQRQMAAAQRSLFGGE